MSAAKMQLKTVSRLVPTGITTRYLCILGSACRWNGPCTRRGGKGSADSLWWWRERRSGRGRSEERVGIGDRHFDLGMFVALGWCVARVVSFFAAPPRAAAKLLISWGQRLRHCPKVQRAAAPQAVIWGVQYPFPTFAIWPASTSTDLDLDRLRFRPT